MKARNNYLTPRRRAPPGNLITAKLVKKFFRLHNKVALKYLQYSQNYSCYDANARISSPYQHIILLRNPLLISPYPQYLSLPVGVFCLGFTTKTLKCVTRYVQLFFCIIWSSQWNWWIYYIKVKSKKLKIKIYIEL